MNFVFYIKTIADKSIVGINYFLRVFVIMMIKRLGYTTRSKEARSVMIYVFILQFLNTGPLLLLINANLSELDVPLFSRISSGAYPDFTTLWYDDVG